jgi:phosphoserine phosphatase RsbU/P
VKRAILLGFDSSVEVHVKVKFLQLFDCQHAVWAPAPEVVRPRKARDALYYVERALKRFDETNNELAIIYTPRVEDHLSWVMPHLQRSYRCHLSWLKCRNDKAELQEALEDYFGVVPAPAIQGHVIAETIGHDEILCVRQISAARVAPILAAAGLVRAGLNIKEVPFRGKANRNKVNDFVRAGAAIYARLLYASAGLGALDPITAEEWGDRAHMGVHAVDVVLSLHRFLLNEQYRLELQEAREAQSALLVQPLPAISGFEFSADRRPVQVVSGDFDLIVTIPDGRVVIAIGDVAGEGAGAGTFAMSLRGQLRVFAKNGTPPEDVCRELHEGLHLVGTIPAATLFYGVLDPQSSTLTYCNAGHPPPRLCRANGMIVMLESTGLPLGYPLKSEYSQKSVTLDVGDRLVLLTDGFLELPKVGTNQFGDEALISVLQGSGSLDAQALKVAILDAASQFSEAGFEDDATIIVVACDRSH